MANASVSGAEGGVLVEERSFKWKINNFDLIYNNNDLLKQQYLEFDFKHSSGSMSKWRASMKYGPSKKAPQGPEGVAIKVRLVKERNYAWKMNAILSLIAEDTDGEKLFTLRYAQPRLFTAGGRLVGWRPCRFNSRSENLNLTDGTIIFTFEFKMITTMMTKRLKDVDMATASAKASVNRKRQLTECIAKLENDEKNSDVKIITGDEQEFFAHRWILSDVSDVFEAMFRCDMKESRTGAVTFQDLSGRTVKLLLHFIYTGNIGEEWSAPGVLEEFIYAADKYQMEDLKNFLDAKLGSICTAENAGNLLAMAEKTSLKKAVVDVLAFIREKCNDPLAIIDIVKKTRIH